MPQGPSPQKVPQFGGQQSEVGSCVTVESGPPISLFPINPHPFIAVESGEEPACGSLKEEPPYHLPKEEIMDLNEDFFDTFLVSNQQEPPVDSAMSPVFPKDSNPYPEKTTWNNTPVATVTVQRLNEMEKELRLVRMERRYWKTVAESYARPIHPHPNTCQEAKQPTPPYVNEQPAECSYWEWRMEAQAPAGQLPVLNQHATVTCNEAGTKERGNHDGGMARFD